MQQVQYASTRITTAYNEIVDIIERATLSNAIPGDGIVDMFVNRRRDQNRVDAKDNPIANKAFMVADVMLMLLIHTSYMMQQNAQEIQDT